MKKFLYVAGFVVLLIALLWVEENWRGIRAWKNYKTELAAQGERLDWKDYSPALVPDAQFRPDAVSFKPLVLETMRTVMYGIVFQVSVGFAVEALPT